MAEQPIARSPEDVGSYLKTVLLLFALLAVVALPGYVILALLADSGWPKPAIVTGQVVLTAASALLLLAAASGLVVVRRARRAAPVNDDLFLAMNRRRSEAALHEGRFRLPFRGLRRALGAPALLVGDAVRIKPAAAIRATLDATGSLEGLPFMAEMERFCGKRARIYRVVDKVYDYGGRKDLRRLRDTVLLHELRCDGAAHGGCQAECYLLWKTAWLEPAERRDGEGTTEAAAKMQGPGPGAALADAPDAIYRCQYTEIVAASQPMSARDLRQYLRPLLAGNVTLAAFLTTVATLVFNTVQGLRGGGAFPWLTTGQRGEPAADLGLQVGERVRVKTAEQIAATLDKRGKNKGLWFDRDMLKRTGHVYTVRARVVKIIDDVTGKMLRMRSPCILLDGVDGTGEYLRFSAQHDYVFWREAWLERVDAAAPSAGPAPPPQAR